MDKTTIYFDSVQKDVLYVIYNVKLNDLSDPVVVFYNDLDNKRIEVKTDRILYAITEFNIEGVNV